MSLTLSDPRHQEHLRGLRRRVVEGLETAIPPDWEPDTLYDPARYALASGGKRIRPVLLLLAAEIFGVVPERALPGALAVEIFHNFTLVHDDIMDGADERRGQPAVHRKWGTSIGLLSGDLLMARSYAELTRLETSDLRPILARYHRMVRRLCEGQAMDEEFPNGESDPVETYLDLIERKTSALLETALEIGGMVGGADEPDRSVLCRLGRRLGRGFQIQDDLLDLTADGDRWGKPIGTDLVEGKRTYLLLQSLERAKGEERALFARIADGDGCAPELVPEVRARMRRLGVLEDARGVVRREYEAAREAVRTLPEHPARAVLEDLVQALAERIR